MKTKNKKDEFQKELDASRKISARVFVFLPSLAGTVLGIATCRQNSSSPITGILIFLFVIVLCDGILWICGYTSEKFDISKMQKKAEEDLMHQQTMKEGLKLQKETQTIQVASMNLVWEIAQQNPETKDHPLLLNLVNQQKDVLTAINLQITTNDDLITKLEDRIEFYASVPERNFWQYFWSMKWIYTPKKITPAMA